MKKNNELVTASKIICIGRNYADHALELGNDIPEYPLVFIKPPSSINHSKKIDINELTQNGQLGSLHYECELSIKIGQTIRKADIETATKALESVTLGLDLTLRDLQNTLKGKGHPWERSKAFDDSCIFGDWLPISELDDLASTHYTLAINDDICQIGDTSMMLFPVIELIANISQQFTLNAGDIIMTGTPKGVNALHSKDTICMELQTKTGKSQWQLSVV